MLVDISTVNLRALSQIRSREGTQRVEKVRGVGRSRVER